MTEKFKCSDCKREFNMKDRGYFSYSQGNLCRGCWSKISKVIAKNQKQGTEQEEKELENKIRKIVNKVLDERNDKKRK